MPSSPSKYSSESTDMNTADSGHGSSLDRGYDRRSGSGQQPSQPIDRNHNMYYKHHRDPNALDLTQHRDQRGSAFELYKKPSVAGDHRLLNGGDHRMSNGGDHRMLNVGDLRISNTGDHRMSNGGGDHRISNGGDHRLLNGGDHRISNGGGHYNVDPVR